MAPDRTAAYTSGIASGKIVAGHLAQGAVRRHLEDLKRVGTPEFPYRFDPAAAERAIAFVEALKHTKGEWALPGRDNHLRLEPWQCFILSMLFGWRRLDGYRRFSKAFISCARKNGKTVLAAAVANYLFFADDPPEAGPECYFLAMKRDQALIAWREAERQIRTHRYLKGEARTYAQTATVVIPGTAARMKPLGRDSDTEDGLSPSCAIIDEYHAHLDNAQVEVMAAGMAARQQPLLFIITTAGFRLDGPCHEEEYALAKQVLEGTLTPPPENYFAIVYELDEGDDWTDEAVWIKANPNLDVSVDRQYLRDRVAEALLSPPKRNKVMTKNLNVWTQAETRWITPEAWAACAFPVDRKALAGRECYLGMDLSATQDVTALAVCFPPLGEGRFEFLYYFFLPEEGIVEKERKDRVPYTYWARQGYLILTPGDVVDYDFIEDTIREIAREFRIREVAFDPWKAQEIVSHLQTEGVAEMVEIRQSYSGMAAGTDAFEKKVLAKELAHGANPVMDWMVSCVEVKSDRQGNVMPMKPERKRSGARIDGVVASILALTRAVVHTEVSTRSVYEDRGIIRI